MLPNFIGIGAQRAGTTWIYNCLKEHPEVFVSEKKELHYFYLHFDKGLQWYCEHFENSEKFIAVGEITPNYMYHEIAVQRIIETIPEVKIFCVLRNPIERAISAFQLLHKRYEGLTFEQVIEDETKIIDDSKYTNHLNYIERLVPEKNLKVMFYDDLKENPKQFISDLYSYLGVDNSYIPKSVTKNYNKIIYPKLQEALYKFKLHWLINIVKKSPLDKIIRGYKSRNNPVKNSIVTKKDLDFLKKEFDEEINELSRRYHRDLSSWLYI